LVGGDKRRPTKYLTFRHSADCDISGDQVIGDLASECLFELPIWNFDDNTNHTLKYQVKVGNSLTFGNKQMVCLNGHLIGSTGEIIDLVTSETSEKWVAAQKFYRDHSILLLRKK
jgi:hypothetical protein